jgi:hypothetical protein
MIKLGNCSKPLSFGDMGEESGSTTNGNDKSFSRRGFCRRICYYYAEIF